MTTKPEALAVPEPLPGVAHDGGAIVGGGVHEASFADASAASRRISARSSVSIMGGKNSSASAMPEIRSKH